MYLRYSFSVDAPTHCSSPRASAGLSMLDASTAPSAAPAPTSVCSSSMNRMMFLFCAISLMTALSRSSNWPRYLVPAMTAAMSSESTMILQRVGALPARDQLRQGVHDRRLAHARFTDQHRIVLLAARQDFHHALDFLLPSDRRIERPFGRELRQVAAEMVQRGRLRFLLALGG